jgi:hypothetical protein
MEKSRDKATPCQKVIKGSPKRLGNKKFQRVIMNQPPSPVPNTEKIAATTISTEDLDIYKKK